MGRKPEGKEPRSETVVIRLTPEGLRALDELRGDQPRSVYIRSLLSREYRHE